MDTYSCAACQQTGVRLYRPYGEFLRPARITCNAHIPGMPESLGWWVPLVVDAADNGVWGYTSCPPEDIARWEALPDVAASPVWTGSRWQEAEAAL